MLIQKISKYNLEGLAKLFTALWTDCNLEEELEHCKKLLESEKDMCFVGKDRGEYIAFIHVSLRFEQVEGATQSPVGYIEGIYVHPDFRKIGIGNHLISLAEKWCKEKGCSQIASDTEIQNTKSITFHKNRGFRETARIVTFIKDV